jgi:hypothetical protein
MTTVTTVNEVLEIHPGLDLGYNDRIYLDVYVANLQVATFLTEHMGDAATAAYGEDGS